MLPGLPPGESSGTRGTSMNNGAIAPGRAIPLSPGMPTAGGAPTRRGRTSALALTSPRASLSLAPRRLAGRGAMASIIDKLNLTGTASLAEELDSTLEPLLCHRHPAPHTCRPGRQQRVRLLGCTMSQRSSWWCYGTGKRSSARCAHSTSSPMWCSSMLLSA
eukprot:scaffold8148_cov241-Isochrysis_galbana.AAC.4